MTRDRPIAVRMAAALFGIAARALPAAFHQAYGRDVREVFVDEAAEAYRAGGIWGLTRATASALADIAVSRRQSTRTPRKRATLMSGFAHDIRYAVRAFRRQPGFTIVALLMLTLGIGGNTAIFSLVNAAFLRPLPYADGDRLVRVWDVRGYHGTADRGPVNPVDAADWQRGTPAIEALGVWTSTSQPLTGAGDPMMVPVAFATPGVLEVLGVTPSLGRALGPEHLDAVSATDILITDGFWRRALGADPAVLGKTVRLADIACTIIGVLPRDFVSPGIRSDAEPQIWRPLIFDRESRGGHYVSAIARLRSGASIADAQAQVAAVAADLSRKFPSTNTGRGVLLEPLREAIGGDSRTAILILMAAVGAVLLIACANVANLLLARAAIRQREMALRGALGATRRRIIQQLMTESLLLAGGAALLGGGLGVIALAALPPWLSDQTPTVITAALDGRVLGFTGLLSFATVIVFGIMPAIMASRFDLRGALAANTAGSGSPPRTLQSVLVVIETALALVLLVSATFLVQSLARLQGVDPGFATSQTLTFRLTLPRARYPEPAQRTAFFETLIGRLAALPGAASAGAVNMSPMSGRYSCDSFAVDDRPAPPDGQEPCAEVRVATPGYFDAMGIRLLTGRQLAPFDTATAMPVAIIGDAMARRYWPNGDAVGRRLKWGSMAADTPWRTIVGVVGGVKHFGLGADAPDEVYMPLQQSGPSALTFAVRTTASSLALHEAVRAVVREADPALAVAEVFTTRELIERSIALPLFRTRLLGAFAVLALLLAMIGVYGLMAFHVAQRRREIGIRLALGARPADVRRRIVARGLTLSGAGCVVGLLAAVPLSGLIGSVLFGITTDDPAAYVIATAAIVATAFTASYLPARKATAVSPVETLRLQ